MDGYRDFTLDPARFPEAAMRALAAELHARGQRYVAIVDPGVATTPPPGAPPGAAYAPFADGLRRVFVRGADGGAPVVGAVWPGAVVWPDLGHPNASG